MGYWTKEDAKKMEKKGFFPVSIAAKKIKRSRTIIDRMVNEGKLECKIFVGIKYVKWETLRKHYGR